MGNKQQKPKLQLPVPSDTTGENKYIYGTYLEMAFHNVFLNLKHIYGVVFGRDIIKEAKQQSIAEGNSGTIDFANEKLIWTPMFNAFKNVNEKPEVRLRIDELLSRHFPVIVPFHDSYKEYGPVDILEHITVFLRILRNEYSHLDFIPNQSQLKAYQEEVPIICNALSSIYNGSKNTLVERNIIHKQKKIYGYFYSDKEKTHITAFGLLTFISLFLEKKYIKILVDKLEVVKPEDKNTISELLSVYRIRLNAQKLSVTKTSDMLALDIINELQRCPKDLFDRLQPDNQKRFRQKADGENLQDILMVRYTDRFPQLVMSYVDNMKLFENIRFQVSLGKYFYKFYDKHCIDNLGETRVRSICKDIHGFGRLNEIEIERRNIWKDIIRDFDSIHKNTAEDKPYITDHCAQYMVNENRIGLRIMDEGKDFHIPELSSNGVRNLSPTCMMSTYELPAMVFLLYLTDGKTVEKIIKDIVVSYRRLFTDIQSGALLPVDNQDELQTILDKDYNGIELKNVPQNMVNYLLGRSTSSDERFQKYAENTIFALLEQTNYKLQKYQKDKEKQQDSKKNKIGTANYVCLKPGKLASFLAKDMMLFQPNGPENNDKLTGLNFRILQSVLATYKGDKESLKRILTNAKIIGKDNDDRCNPIVKKMLQSNIPVNLEKLYKEYLEKRKLFLEKCIKKAHYKDLDFLHPTQSRWLPRSGEFCKLQAGRYLKDSYGGVDFEKAIDLPRGMFDKAIREALKCIPSMTQLAQDYTKNISYLIYAYFMLEKNDDCQPFYNYGRCYDLLKKIADKSDVATPEEIRNMLNAKHPASLKLKINKNIEETDSDKQENKRQMYARMLSEMKNSETDFKRYKIQDMLLLLIAKKIFVSNINDDVQAKTFENIKLKDITDGKTLSQKVKVSIRVESKNGNAKNITNSELKLKNYAGFYHILNDQRLPSLLDLVKETDVDHKKIEDEFDGYDSVRPHIMHNVMYYEDSYHKLHPTSKVDKFADMVKESQEFTTDQRNYIIGTRNSFAHNSYPCNDDIKIGFDICMPDKAKVISEQFRADLKKTINN